LGSSAAPNATDQPFDPPARRRALGTPASLPHFDRPEINMTLLQSLHLQSSATDVGSDGASNDTAAPIDGYDRLDARKVIAQLPQRSQTELATIETHERAHKDRPAVLNKLGYLRGEEPLRGYDDLAPEQIATELDGADLDTAKRVREYERKFKRRSSVLDAVDRTRDALKTTPTSISNSRENPPPSSG
jgi:hypothetical protein